MAISKNKVKTAGYLIKRLRDNGFIVLKTFAFYAKSDPRVWTILVNPGEASVFITCHYNKEMPGEILFEINDGGNRIPRGMFLKTDSAEIIVQYLLEHGASNKDYYPGKRLFIKTSNKPALNINSEKSIAQKTSAAAAQVTTQTC